MRKVHCTKTEHLKFNKLLQFLKLIYFWSFMAKEVRDFVKRYDVCSKISFFIKFWPLRPMETQHLFELVSLDMAHFTMPLGNKKYIVVVIEYYKRWIKATIVTKETTQSIVSFI